MFYLLSAATHFIFGYSKSSLMQIKLFKYCLIVKELCIEVIFIELQQLLPPQKILISFFDHLLTVCLFVVCFCFVFFHEKLPHFLLQIHNAQNLGLHKIIEGSRVVRPDEDRSGH